MKRALIIGSSGGIGSAVTRHLQGRGWAVDGLSRRETGFDLTDDSVVDAQMSALGPGYDMILIASGALEIGGAAPEKTVRSIDAKALADQFALNAIGPALVLRHAARLLPKDRKSVVAALSARVGSIGDNRLGGWTSYRASKAALNQILRCTAIELARSHKQAVCVGLHPGTVSTPFTQKYSGQYPMVTPDAAARNLLAVIENLKPDQTGGFYDWAGKTVPW
ncbi:SDR family NAD(P)-dependent oxidoreductase [Pelagimonas varians]|uniref:C-factor n=1 Tax=Pelagimonas varians TaxID=696760 RepID=A0A238KJK1_9RHOB|nr:SDR family NAD(P)-dependent oxidoreductase [Pelagimonas varians]PYG29532.1 NAD(P)-dependent dehydrogenase (short-subunit alcohol dehydrogenase family) [Pelagimonas varians]SMX42874.1 C-factor [Pelagimonas varians]